jgi:HEAT repeat protein
VAPLLGAMVGDPALPLRVRQEAALALATVGNDSVVPALAAALEAAAADAGGEQLRISIIQALGGIGSAEARLALGRHAARKLSKTERAFMDQALPW